MELIGLELGNGVGLENGKLINLEPIKEIVVPEIPFDHGAIKFGFLLKVPAAEWRDPIKFSFGLYSPTNKLLEGLSGEGLPSQTGSTPPYMFIGQGMNLIVREKGIYTVKVVIQKLWGGNRQSLQKKFAVYVDSKAAPSESEESSFVEITDTSAEEKPIYEVTYRVRGEGEGFFGNYTEVPGLHTGIKAKVPNSVPPGHRHAGYTYFPWEKTLSIGIGERDLIYFSFHNIRVTDSESTAEIWVDGKLIASETSTGGMLCVGRDGDSFIDENLEK